MPSLEPPFVPPPAPPRETFAAWVAGTFAGRALVFGVIAAVAALLLGRLVGDSTALDLLGAAGAVSVAAGLVALARRLFGDIKRRLLWRVRRKLTLLYIFIGFVPALLIIAFFVTAGWLFVLSIGTYVMRTGVATQVDHAQFLAQSAALDVQRAASAADAVGALERRQVGAAQRYPYVSYAVVPIATACDSGQPAPPDAVIVGPAAAGPWHHLEPPRVLPSWVPCDGFAGLVVYTAYGRSADGIMGNGGATRFAMRAVALPDDPTRQYAVVVDVPLSQTLVLQFRQATGIEIGNITAVGMTSSETGRNGDGGEGAPAAVPDGFLGTAPGAVLDWVGVLDYVAVLDYRHWETGSHGAAWVAFRMGIGDLYNRIVEAPITPIGDYTFGEIILTLLAVLGGLILAIQFATFGMGLGLARSISGSVHELFAGTARLRRGDFSQAIAVQSQDQLGDLADSFNSMTASIRDLLQQKAEKDRLEQELLIARRIQMSLLPQGLQAFPGVALTGHCEPAREVGGDYYDVLPLDDHRLGLLIADVAGKGTSAALYMAELKGVVLSLSRYHASPRQLLIDADQILAHHLDARSFITVTYAVIDTQAHTLTYARAGHCPLILVPGPQAPSRAPQILAPNGMVLGLQIDRGDMFERLLDEITLPLASGDLILLYTDGITEAMNAAGECFGDVRLAQLVRDHADLSTAGIRDVILREIRVFSGTALQHDDMTLLVLRMEDVAEAAYAPTGDAAPDVQVPAA